MSQTEAFIPNHPVDHPSAWRSADLARDQSWVHTLDELELCALHDAVTAVQAKGGELFKFTGEDFHLGAFAPRLANIVAELEGGRGCVWLRGLDISRFTEVQRWLVYWGLGVHMGYPISQNARGERISQVTNGGRDYEAKNVRGYTTRMAIRPHCDPSDIVGLFCVQAALSGGDNSITSSISIFNTLLSEHPEFLAPLSEGFHFDLRGEGATGHPDEVTHDLIPVFSFVDGLLSARYNQKTIEDGMRKAGKPLSGNRSEAVHAVGQLALRDELRYDLTLAEGDILFLNNYTVLHARKAFEDDIASGRKRNLLRLWVNLHEGRELDPAFANRLNTGPRGGSAIKGVDYD